MSEVQKSRKPFPTVVSCGRPLRSTVVSEVQPRRKKSPTVVSRDRPLRSTVVSEVQRKRKAFPTVVTCDRPLRSTVVSEVQSWRKKSPTVVSCDRSRKLNVVNVAQRAKMPGPTSRSCFSLAKSTAVAVDEVKCPTDVSLVSRVHITARLFVSTFRPAGSLRQRSLTRRASEVDRSRLTFDILKCLHFSIVTLFVMEERENLEEIFQKGKGIRSQNRKQNRSQNRKQNREKVLPR